MKIILNEDAKSFLECIAVDIKHAMDVIYRMHGAVRFQKFHLGSVFRFCGVELEPRFGVGILKRTTIQSICSINCNVTSK